MRSVVKKIFSYSQETPEKTAIIASDRTVSYSDFWKLIQGTAIKLKEKDILEGDRVILEASHTVEYLVCCYAIHLAKAVHVPVEKDIPDDRVAAISSEIKPKMVLKGPHPFAQLNLSFDSLIDNPATVRDFPSEDMLQEILFTTGTTGKSKGVMVTHFAQMNMCESQNAVLDYSKDNVWLIPTPMNHAAGLRKTHMSMVNGSTVLLIDGFKNLKLFFDSMRSYKVTSLYLPPSAVHYILMLAPKELACYDEQLDFLYSSSSALPGGDKEKLIELLPHVRKFDAYGGSEVGAVCYIDYNSEHKGIGCVGKANPGVDIFIVDEDYKPYKASKENPGIIAIRSNTVTSGYWNEPKLTADTIHDGVIYMTDLGYLDNDGYLYLVGRRDDVINIGGLKVAPTEVEDVALRFDKISECACVPFEDKNYGRVLKMYVAMKDGFSFNTEEIVSYLETKLEAYKIPKQIECIPEIPKTYNGKIDRKKLIARDNN
ncbi:MAG: acyl--CoA ligase [Bacteroidaceae bacterium]|nr:acyl--CoA ligase [Bacteroidaceae bacterium]